MLGVGGADAVELFSLEVEGVILREDEAAGVLVDGIVGGAVAQVGGGEEGGDVGVVHEELAAESVHFVCIDLSEFRMVVDSIFLESSFNFVCEVSATLCKLRL